MGGLGTHGEQQLEGEVGEKINGHFFPLWLGPATAGTVGQTGGKYLLNDIGCCLYDGLSLAGFVARRVTLDLDQQMRLAVEIHNQLAEGLGERHSSRQQDVAVGGIGEGVGARPAWKGSRCQKQRNILKGASKLIITSTTSTRALTGTPTPGAH